MANLRYVCLSDLHLGADYSILTPTERDLEAPGPVLTTFAAALRQLIAGLPTSATSPPQLLVHGDLLDLGLSPLDDVAKGFQRFVEALLVPPTPLAPDLRVIPGNHDHMIWQWALEEHYVKKLRHGKLETMKPVTRLFAEPAADGDAYPKSRLLTTLLRQVTKNDEGDVYVAYPNFGLSNGSGRCIVFSHGHFVESMYRLMSQVRRFLRLGGPGVRTIEDLEAENAPWIDFVWSTFGDTGALGKEMQRLYEQLQDAAANAELTSELAKRLTTRLLPHLPMGGEPLVRTWAERILHAVLDATVERMGDLERNSYAKPLTDDTVEGLRWYLDVPLRNQIDAALERMPGATIDDVAFVFGHTHKPFQDAIALERYARPVRVFNTGGWVLDEPTMSSREGASIVLVDDDLNVVAVRLFHQPLDGTVDGDGKRGVYVPTSGADPAGNPLRAAVEHALAAPTTAQAFRDFVAAVSQAFVARQRALIERFDLPRAGVIGGVR
ncbi:MAG TPA: metallophosphoesterase [Candidatus Binatia bacterium]